MHLTIGSYSLSRSNPFQNIFCQKSWGLALRLEKARASVERIQCGIGKLYCGMCILPISVDSLAPKLALVLPRFSIRTGRVTVAQ